MTTIDHGNANLLADSDQAMADEPFATGRSDPTVALLARAMTTAGGSDAAAKRLGDVLEDRSLDDITRLAAALTESPMAAIGLVGASRLRFKSSVGCKVEDLSRSDAFCAPALAAGRLLEIEDARRDPRFAGHPLVLGAPGVRYYAGMPLALPGGDVVGVLSVMDRVPRRLEARQRMALHLLARNVAAELALHQRIAALEAEVSRRQESELRMMHMATRDPLTRLPNRAAMLDRLEQAIRLARRDGSQVAVMFLDLDRFKWINDTLGHDVGDALLQEVAVRVTASLRESDTVARLGGDEFAVILPSVGSEQDGLRLAHQVIAEVSRPMTVAGHTVQVGCSLGLALHPAHGDSGEALLRHADLSMYAAKEAGGEQCRTYSDEMSVRAVERMTLEGELRAALTGDELELVYQPQVRICDQVLTGLEALVRWNHPRLGRLAPERFIPVAEDSGLIWALGLRVLDMAVAQVAAWRQSGLKVPRVAVNVSALQLRGDLVEAVADTLRRHGVAGEALELEITESALATDGPGVLPLLRTLREMGVAIAVDDFGVGYSSMALMRRLPVTTLKIDRSFITELDSNKLDLAIVQAVVTMANSVGLRTVAEGVEEPTQNAVLRVLGCEVGQGYLYGRPADVATAAIWLDRAEAA